MSREVWPSAARLHDAVRSGDVSVVGRVRKQEARADHFDGLLGAFNARIPVPDDALREAEDRIRAGAARPLEGVTVGVKDVILVAGIPTTGQSELFATGWGADVDADAVARLRDAGAIIVGATSTMELAYGLPEPQKPFGFPRNPWSPDHFPGGSSSGSAVGVVAGFFDAALGTDTGGSIRIPSAMSGSVGLKPTFDAVSRDGVMTLGRTLDHVGPMALTAGLCRDLFRVLSDRTDDAQSPTAGARPLDGIRVGVDRLDAHAAGIDSDQPAVFDAAIATLRELGAVVRDVRLPDYAAQSAASLISLVVEAADEWGALLRERGAFFNVATRILLRAGLEIDPADYRAAQEVRASTASALTPLFDEVDVIVTPTSHLGAPSFDVVDPYAPTSFLPSVHTGYWSGAGLPSLAIPIGFTASGLPLSMLVNAGRDCEETALRIGEAFQAATRHHLNAPVMAR